MQMLVKFLPLLWKVLTLFLLGCAILFCYTFYHLLKYYKYWEKRGVPIEKNFILVKNVKNVFKKKHFGEFLSDLYRKHNNVPYFGFYVFGQPHLFIRDPKIIKTIAIKDFNYFENRTLVCNKKVDAIVAKSCFVAENPDWRATRSKLNGLFSPAKVKSMIPVIMTASKKMEAYLGQCDNQIVDFKEVAENFMTNIGPAIFLGIDSHCGFGKEANETKSAIKNLFGRGWYQGFAFFSYIFVPKLVSLFNLKIANYDFLKHMTNDTMTYKENSNIKGKGIADLLLTTQEGRDKNESLFDKTWIISQALTIIAAGFSPTTTLYTLTLYELSFAQQCQDQIRKEILENFPGNEPITLEKVIKMPYLHMVTSETLRKNPIAAFLMRRCTQDYTIKETGLTIEKGTPIATSLYAIHVDPVHYPDPYHFNPERFREGTKQYENAGVFMPFGNGPRRCLGERFAYVAAKLAIVHVFKNFRVEPCHSTQKHVVYDPKALGIDILGAVNLRVHKL